MDYSKYKVNSIFNGKTVLDFFNFYHLSKSKHKDLKIYINENEASLNSILLKDDILKIGFIESIDFKPLDKPLKIIYEDDYLLIIDKMVGIIVHPDDKEKNGTLVNIVANYFNKIGLNRNVRYIHRIDTETSGIIMFAKDMITASYYNYLFSVHEVKRTYLAIACGKINSSNMVINQPIGSDRHHNQRRRVSKTGQKAVTYLEKIKELKRYTVVKLNLETGRTHQIRVHMKYIGHPLAGDSLYEGSIKDIKRVALHSHKIQFKLPYNFKNIELEASIPKDMMDVISSD